MFQNRSADNDVHPNGVGAGTAVKSQCGELMDVIIVLFTE